MATSGPNIAGTGADDATVGTQAWVNPTRINADDGSFATCSIGTGISKQTHYAKGTAFSFSIPGTATINGILVEWKKKASSTNLPLVVHDAVVSLLKAGTVTGDNKADLTTNWSLTSAYVSYGSGSDLWGTTWSPSEINDATFGAVMSATLIQSSDSSITASLDAVRITITYTDNGTVTVVSQTLPYMGAG